MTTLIVNMSDAMYHPGNYGYQSNTGTHGHNQMKHHQNSKQQSIPQTAARTNSRHNIPQIADSIPHTASVSIIDDLTAEIKKKIKQHDRDMDNKNAFYRKRSDRGVMNLQTYIMIILTKFVDYDHFETFLDYLQWFNSEKHTAESIPQIFNKIHYDIDTFVDFLDTNLE